MTASESRTVTAHEIFNSNTVLADEPTGSLDKNNATKVIAILKQMNYEGKTIIMVTHDDDYLGVANKLIQL